jgi:hypothetical protein
LRSAWSKLAWDCFRNKTKGLQAWLTVRALTWHAPGLYHIIIIIII